MSAFGTTERAVPTEPIDLVHNYRKFLFRLKHQGRSVNTWLETRPERKEPFVGERIKIPEKFQQAHRASGLQWAIVTSLCPFDNLLVIYLADAI